MNWKKVLRNVVFGYILVMIPIMVMPYLLAWLSRKMDSIVPFGLGLLSLAAVIYLTFSMIIPSFGGYHIDEKKKKFQVGVIQFVVCILMLVSMWILTQINFYKM